MLKNRLIAMFAISFGVCAGAVYAADSADVTAGQALHIDIPVKIESANVAIDMGHLVFAGDAPFALGDLHLLADNFRDWSTKGKIVAVFHGDAAYLVLNDDAYDANRHIQTGHPVHTGNPYGKLFASLMDQGIQIEL